MPAMQQRPVEALLTIDWSGPYVTEILESWFARCFPGPNVSTLHSSGLVLLLIDERNSSSFNQVRLNTCCGLYPSGRTQVTLAGALLTVTELWSRGNLEPRLHLAILQVQI